MSALPYILLATFIDSLLGLVGIFSLYLSEEKVYGFVSMFVGFAAGVMMGGALLHILPEALEKTPSAPEIFIAGFMAFFVLERYLQWHHCHRFECDVHPVGYLTIVGDGIHNFIDGLVIAASFLSSFHIGIITTLAVILHELPQELGNFAVLIHAGFGRKEAIIWSFLSQATCLLGGFLGFFTIPSWLVAPLLAFAGGGFLYIAASDLVPFLHQEKSLKKSSINFLLLFAGVLVMELIKFLI